MPWLAFRIMSSHSKSLWMALARRRMQKSFT